MKLPYGSSRRLTKLYNPATAVLDNYATDLKTYPNKNLHVNSNSSLNNCQRLEAAKISLYLGDWENKMYTSIKWIIPS